jgi:hypothetical protein
VSEYCGAYLHLAISSGYTEVGEVRSRHSGVALGSCLGLFTHCMVEPGWEVGVVCVDPDMLVGGASAAGKPVDGLDNVTMLALGTSGALDAVDGSSGVDVCGCKGWGQHTMAHICTGNQVEEGPMVTDCTHFDPALIVVDDVSHVGDLAKEVSIDDPGLDKEWGPLVSQLVEEGEDGCAELRLLAVVAIQGAPVPKVPEGSLGGSHSRS